VKIKIIQQYRWGFYVVTCFVLTFYVWQLSSFFSLSSDRLKFVYAWISLICAITCSFVFMQLTVYSELYK